MLGHELVVRDVDEQVLFLESLDDGREDDGDDFERRGRDAGLADEDAGVEVVLADVLGEGAHLLDADGGFGGEFDPDGADLGEWGRGRVRGQWGVFLEHAGRGFEGCGHFAPVWRAAGIGEPGTEFVEGDADFFFGELVALVINGQSSNKLILVFDGRVEGVFGCGALLLYLDTSRGPCAMLAIV